MIKKKEKKENYAPLAVAVGVVAANMEVLVKFNSPEHSRK